MPFKTPMKIVSNLKVLMLLVKILIFSCSPTIFSKILINKVLNSYVKFVARSFKI